MCNAHSCVARISTSTLNFSEVLNLTSGNLYCFQKPQPLKMSSLWIKFCRGVWAAPRAARHPPRPACPSKSNYFENGGKDMKKIFVLDTNVVLADARSIFAFGDNDVVIPYVVLIEVDSKKDLKDEVGYNAREFSRLLDELRKRGRLDEGVVLDNGGTLRVMGNDTNDRPDSQIILTAKKLKEDYPERKVILVSKDTSVRVRADVLGVEAETYLHDRVLDSLDEGYKGYDEITVDEDIINIVKTEKEIDAEVLGVEDFPENHFFVLNRWMAVRKKGSKLIKTYPYHEGVFGLRSKNIEQEMALNLLMDTDVPLVTINGKAGTGKTLLALAAGLEQVIEQQRYSKILVARPPVEHEWQIGFLPGEIEEKLRPFMQPIYDNLEYLFNCKSQKELENTLIGYEHYIEVQSLSHIRGRSIPNQFIIVDEAQNMSKHAIKTLLTRVGEGSKVVLVGDPNQIDDPYLDAFSCGLTYAIERLKHLKETGHITLRRGERSTLAQLCADLL